MIMIDDKLIGDEIVEAHFVCDLAHCKGGCCEDGDAGAPLEDAELAELRDHYSDIAPYMTERGKAEVARQGLYVYDDRFGNVTPTIDGGLCVYAFRDENDIIKCAVEQAYNEGKLDWKKPISCHLFPIRVSHSDYDEDLEMLNYEPREDEHLCNPACRLGEKLKVPVYKFLKEPIIRKYGEEFYETLEATASHLSKEEE